MSKQSDRSASDRSATPPRDIPMPTYRYQSDTGSSKVSSGDGARRASSDLLRGCNLGG